MNSKHEPCQTKRTAGEAGWRLSRYNLSARVPGRDTAAIANLFRGTCAEYSPMELYLLSILERLDEHHPIIDRFARRGIITRMDELAALETMGRGACAAPQRADLTICPTMDCNFSCPYCFERHRRGKMSRAVQNDVVALAGRMLDEIGGKALNVTWFGGEPLLAADVLESLSERLMALCREKGAVYSAGIITNGYLLDQKKIDMLARCNVQSCQVTIDGLGSGHDATRHLKNGAPTFERIIGQLRTGNIPFKVYIRQNVLESNMDAIPEMQTYIRKLAKDSGNNIDYSPAPVTDNRAAEERGERIRFLCETNLTEVGLLQEARRFTVGRGHFCGAHSLFSVGIDENGCLFKCWEDAGVDALAFGHARDWDPADPLNTASDPDRLTMYLNTALPMADEECRACVWLPLCVGGCPHHRLFGNKVCFPFRDQPERYVLALHARIGEKKERHDKEETDEFCG